MEVETRKDLVELLRAVISQSIPEADFWKRFDLLANRSSDAWTALVHEVATHYWGNFHSRNLLGMKVKPDPYQVQQGQEELNLIADGLGGCWPIEELKRRLNDV